MNLFFKKRLFLVLFFMSNVSLTSLANPEYSDAFFNYSQEALKGLIDARAEKQTSTINIKEIFEHFIASISNANEATIKLDQKSQRYNALGLAMTINSSRQEGIVNSNSFVDGYERVLRSTSEQALEEHKVTAFWVKKFGYAAWPQELRKEQTAIAACLRVLLDVAAKKAELKSNDKSHSELLARLYFFIVFNEHPALGRVLASWGKKPPEYKSSSDREGIIYNDEVKAFINDVVGKKTDTDDELNNFVDEMENFLQGHSVKVAEEQDSVATPLLNEQNIDENEGPSEKYIDDMVNSIDSDRSVKSIAHRIFKLGLIFAVYPHVFAKIKHTIETSSNENLVKKMKHFWGRIFKFILETQNRLDKKIANIIEIKAFFNGVLSTIIVKEFLTASDGGDALEAFAKDVVHEEKSYLQNIHAIIKLLFQKNINDLQVAKTRKGYITWLVVASVAVVGIGAVAALTGGLGIPLAAVAVSGGASALAGGFSGSKAWDSITGLVSGHPEKGYASKIKTKIFGYMHPVIREMKETSGEDARSAETLVEIMVAQQSGMVKPKVTEETIQKAVTEIAIPSAVNEPEPLQKENISKIFSSILDRFNRLEARIKKLEDKKFAL